MFRLILTVEHFSATTLIANQREYLTGLLTNNTAKPAAEGGLAHLNYLDANWMSISLWQSWSEWGRLTAAAAIKIPVEGIIPTTNHLESFNAVLKRKYIQQHVHSGHRLRFDILIFLLITQILPQIYNHRRLIQEHRRFLNERFSAAAGGQNLLELQTKLAESEKERS